MKRSNVSIFVPFAGCPNRCSFCDQHSITGKIKPTTAEDVRNTIETALASEGIDSMNSEIAFFGGSFTAIDREYMLSLLDATKAYIHRFRGIRISTRPDCIDNEILSLLSAYNVTSIELGAQSMSDEVLLLNDRGHNSESVRTASKLIRSHGISLGLQMMTGLYGSTDELDEYTAREFISLQPDTVRIYPTVVLKNTKLSQLCKAGEYIPQKTEDAARLCSRLIPMFEDAGIKVIRVGLHSSDTMEDSIVGGAYHPAFKELCESRIFLDIILNELVAKGISGGSVAISVAPQAISKIIGQRKSNLTKLASMGYTARIIPDDTLKARQIKIQEG